MTSYSMMHGLRTASMQYSTLKQLSPDVNLLDLGIFRAIQSFNDTAPRNKEELIEVVSVAYDKYPCHKIN